MASGGTFNPTRPVSVLIVDDELMMRKILRLIMHEMGFKVDAEASSGHAVMQSSISNSRTWFYSISTCRERMVSTFSDA